MRRFLLWAIAVGGLPACSGGSPAGLTSDFAPASSSGTIGQLDEVYVSNQITSNLTGNSFAYEVGGVTDDGFHAYSGLVPGAVVAAPPTSGQTTYTGAFFAALIGDVTSDGQFVYGTSVEDTGNITMAIDFGQGTMTASGIGIDDQTTDLLSGNSFEAEGTFAGTQMTGTVTYNGVSGPMSGLMGADEAIGVFHGQSATQLQAGGFGAAP